MGESALRDLDTLQENALKELNAKVRSLRKQETELGISIGKLRAERTAEGNALAAVKTERAGLTEEIRVKRRAADDYRTDQVGKIEAAGVKSQERETAAIKAEKEAAQRIQQAQAAEASLTERVERVATITGTLYTTIIDAVKKAIRALNPKVDEQAQAPSKE